MLRAEATETKYAAPTHEDTTVQEKGQIRQVNKAWSIESKTTTTTVAVIAMGAQEENSHKCGGGESGEELRSHEKVILSWV